jgi:hypothetical protein
LNQCFLGSQPLLSPTQEAANLAALGRPAPPELARCNALANPLGEDAARGWVLLSRVSLNAINLNALQTLTIQDDETPQCTMTIPGLVIASDPIGLTAGITANDPDSAYIVELADARWRLANPLYCVPVAAQYNVRAPAYQTSAVPYYANSTNAGAAWTWLTLVQNLWGLMATWLGSAPSALPFTPNGTPEGFIFLGTSAWRALCDVLHRIQCAVRWAPLTGVYSIVRLGIDDPAFDQAIAGAIGRNRKIADKEYINAIRGEVPYGVTVYFHAINQIAGAEETVTLTPSAWQTRTPYSVQLAGGVAGAEPGIYTPIWDDMPALYDYTSTLLNGAALATRAAERASDYFRRLQSLTKRYFQGFSGLISVVPTGICTGVAWRQDAAGAWMTEVSRSDKLGLHLGGGGSFWKPGEPDSTNLHPPDFGPTQPSYPVLIQLVRVTSTTAVSPPAGSTALVYSGYTEQLQTSLLPRDREACYVTDPNGTGLGLGCYLGRLAGQFNGLPVYESIGMPVSVTYTDVTITYSDSTINYYQSQINITNNSVVNFGYSTSVSVNPPGIFSKPTQTVTGQPTWTPNALTVIDNDTTGFSLTGSFWSPNFAQAGAYGGYERYCASGTGADVATWTFTDVLPDTYSVQAFWFQYSNRATNATYLIYDGTTLVGTVAVNQQNAPTGGFTSAGFVFQPLGSFVINSGTLKVTLSDNANGYVIADAVGYVPVDPYYPMVWGAYDNIDWEWSGTAWIPIVGVGRTPVNDANYTAVVTDRDISYTAITAPRTITAPPANSLPQGFMLRITDESGSASTTKSILFGPAGSDTVNKTSGAVAVCEPFGRAVAETDGVSNWTVTGNCCGTTQLTVITGVTFNPTTCVLTVTSQTICIPTAFINATCPAC